MILRPSGERTAIDCAALSALAGAQAKAAMIANRIACSLIFPPDAARHFLMSWNLAAPPFVYEL
jgi:hypothetical protein